ncbi:glycosyltransferase family 4 protein [Aliikangiella sp. IMCC44359]|uniref:glycosyltransferase family 4 protein n=1 Tax=Aliikangiella sp. IMCC44359 TaxID=3459125 RepID=UPI00403B1FD3
MKIAYIVSLFPCWSETFIVREINSLKKAGHEVDIVSLKHPSESLVQSDAEALMGDVLYPEKGVSLFINIFKELLFHPFKSLHMFWLILTRFITKPEALAKTFATLFVTLGVLKKVRQLNLEHVHAHWATYPSTSAFIIHKYLGIPYSFTFHAHDIFLEDHMLAVKFDSCAFGVTISDFNINFIYKLLNKDYSHKIKIVHCGVDLTAQKYNVENRSENTIFTIGRLDEIKGFKYLIEACSLLKQKSIDFKCVMVGDGPLKKELLEQRSSLGLTDNIEFLGAMPQEKIREFLNNVTLFVLPSVKTKEGNMDGVPVALMEAMASGTPVISTYISGIPELITNEENGLLVNPNNAEELATAIARLLENSDLRLQYAKQANATIQESFCAEKEGAKLGQYFQDYHADNLK